VDWIHLAQGIRQWWTLVNTVMKFGSIKDKEFPGRLSKKFPVKVFFGLVHRLHFNKITTFRKLDLLPSSGKKGRTETLAVRPPG
jgi:hypothetical protein